MPRFSQLLNWTAGISETGKFLKVDLHVNLESKQGPSLDLNLHYPESHEIFLVLGFTEGDIFEDLPDHFDWSSATFISPLILQQQPNI